MLDTVRHSTAATPSKVDQSVTLSACILEVPGYPVSVGNAAIRARTFVAFFSHSRQTSELEIKSGHGHFH
jgi:hypothetical protein